MEICFPFVSKVDKHVVIPFTSAADGQTAGTIGRSRQGACRQTRHMVVIYAYGDYRSATRRSAADSELPPIFDVNRAECLAFHVAVEGFITRNPFGDLAASQRPRSNNRERPDHAHAKSTKRLDYCVAACSASWLLCHWARRLRLARPIRMMPTRIRSNGMSVACLLQYGRVNHDRRDLPADGRQAMATPPCSLPSPEFNGYLLHHRRVLPPRNQGQDPGRDRRTLQRARQGEIMKRLAPHLLLLSSAAFSGFRRISIAQGLHPRGAVGAS